MDSINEPKLAEYGLDASSYKEHKGHKERIDSWWFVNLYPILFFIGIILFLYSMFNDSDGKILISIIIIFVGYLLRLKSLKLQEEENSIRTKVVDFENSIVNFYESKLDFIFKNYLYKKRSDNPMFNIYISKFWSLIDRVQSLNKDLIFQKISLNSKLNNNNYIGYLIKRSFYSTSIIKKENNTNITHISNDNLENTEVREPILSQDNNISSNTQINTKKIYDNNSSDKKIEKEKGFWANLMNDVRSEIEEANNTSTKETINTIDIVSPDKKYSIPRKIDWENINKNKAITGLKGEEIAVEIEKEYLKSINREDLAEKVKQVSIEGDGFGYDILSYFPDGQEKYIEVKSSKNSNSNSFNISSNELDFMKRNQYNYQIYRMFNINEKDEAPTLRVHTANDILSFKKITPVQYVVKME